MVSSERVEGRVKQRFVVGLGTMKRGCRSVRDDAEHRRRFLEGALRKLLWYGLPHELEDKLLAEFAGKAGILAEDVKQCRVWRRARQERGEDQAEALERLDRLEAVMMPAADAA